MSETYVSMFRTLGASDLQIIRKAFIPSVLSELFDDIRVLVAISWTYIIIAEMLNMNRGIGAALYESTRQSRIDETFALLIVIIVIGIVQDSMFKWLDTILFKHKRNTEKK